MENHPREGFASIELMVALTIAAILAAILDQLIDMSCRSLKVTSKGVCTALDSAGTGDMTNCW